MATVIRNLWPEDVTNVDILSPLAILRYQASQLRQRTRNLLEAEVESSISGAQITHRFTVIAPALDRYRIVLFSVSHNELQVYPAAFFAEWFVQQYGIMRDNWPVAASQSDFIIHTAEILKSSHTKSLIQSLIVKSNEARAPESGDPSMDESAPQ